MLEYICRKCKTTVESQFPIQIVCSNCGFAMELKKDTISEEKE